MLDKIIQIETKYNELGLLLSDPATAQDYNKFRDLSKQRKAMEETVEVYHKFKEADFWIILGDFNFLSLLISIKFKFFLCGTKLL